MALRRRETPSQRQGDTPRQAGNRSAGLAIDHPADCQILDTWTWNLTPVQDYSHGQAMDLLAAQIRTQPNVINDWEGGWGTGGAPINYPGGAQGWVYTVPINTNINQMTATPPTTRASAVLASLYAILRKAPEKVAGST